MRHRVLRWPEATCGDELAGDRSAVPFAIMLAAVCGGVAVTVFMVGLQLVDAFGPLDPGPGGLLTGAALWLAFWAGLSGGLIGGLTLGYRAWRRVAPPIVRRAVEADAREQQAAAVRATEQLIERHASSRDG